MQHYFGSLIDGEIVLSEKDLHHFLDVKRPEINEKIEVCLEDGVYLCHVASLRPLKLVADSKIEEDRETSIDLSLAFALLKGDHNELIVLKGTEVGVDAFLPFTSKRTVVTPKGKEDNKLLRLRKIAQEGAEQCRRACIPEVQDYSSIKEVLSREADLKLFAYEGIAGTGTSLLNLCKEELHPGVSVLLVIGPEGGFSDEEAALAKEKGFRFVSLGKRILRAETAAIVASNLITSFAEENE